jgi:hypothetical protein
MGRIAAVGTLALLLAGTTAAPAGAMLRSEARRIARAVVDMCFNVGGDPAMAEGGTGSGGVFSVICDYPDGTSMFVMYDYSNPGYEPPEWETPDMGRDASRRAVGGESARTVAERGSGAAAADHGWQKAHKHHKHKHQRHGGKHGRH